MKRLKRFNENLSNLENTSNQIFITKINSDKPFNYGEEKLSIYIEDGQLRPAKYIICHDMDMEGRYKTGVLGIYKISPEHFDIEIKTTADGKKTYQKCRLNQSGIDYLKSVSSGRWSTDFDLVDEQYIQNLILQNEKSIESLQRGIEKYQKLLSE
jgi:hypothetical protein